jgi:hypothetical protein
MVRIINPFIFALGGGYDSDAAAYIAAVETADAASLATKYKDAINDFVVGAKSDGFWSAIKAACFLAGPATLAGALVPLVGTAPTNVNFVSGDYNRVSGLVGNGSSKYLNSNRAGNADPQNTHHLSVWIGTNSGTGIALGRRSGGFGTADDGLNLTTAANWPFRSRISAFDAAAQGTRSLATATGFAGLSRAASGTITTRVAASNETVTTISTAPTAETYGVFARRRTDTGTIDAYTSSRLAWYSIGENLDLSLLESRLATYMAAIA